VFIFIDANILIKIYDVAKINIKPSIFIHVMHYINTLNHSPHNILIRLDVQFLPELFVYIMAFSSCSGK